MEEELIESPPVPGPFFRFTDEAAWLTAARAAGFMTTVPVYDEEGSETGTEEVIDAYTANHAIDVIGILYNDDGVYDVDENGEDIVVSPPTVMAGWHVNYLGALPEGWEEYEVTPETPKRVFT